jgi:hypothetical protein
MLQLLLELARHFGELRGDGRLVDGRSPAAVFRRLVAKVGSAVPSDHG